MPNRQRISVPFGPGLDRETGKVAVRRGTMEDLRNVYFRRDKLVLRKGHTSKLSFQDSDGNNITHIIAGQMLLGERTGVVVGYQGDDTAPAYGDVDIYATDVDLTVQRRIGTWFNTADQGLDPSDIPLVIVDDVYNRAFFAHDEFRVKSRAPTVVYDPFEGPLLQTLRVSDKSWPGYDDSLSDSQQPPIKFRGVQNYLAYLVGWGFGDSQEDRPDMLRISLPAEPKIFRHQHYANVGSRDDPTVTAKPAGGVLAVFKETESYRLVGYSRENFGIEPLDTRHGCLAPRLATEVGDTCFFWSQDGPRVCDGAKTEDISENLELDGFEPSDLVARGELGAGWANYLNSEDLVLFAFNRRVYVLSLHNRDQPRWTYWTLGFDQYCGFQLYSTGVGDPEVVAPTGHPEWEWNAAARSGGELRPAWDNVGADGDEQVELWIRQATNLLGRNWRVNEDSDGDGIADLFASSNTDAAVTASFTHDDTAGPHGQAAQKISVTGSTGQGRAEVLTPKLTTGIEAGKDYTVGIELLLANIVGGFEARLELEWLDAGDGVLRTDELTNLTLTGEFERRFLYDQTAPANAAKVRLRCIAYCAASGDTGEVSFRLLNVSKVEDMGEWRREAVWPVNQQTDQIETAGGLPEGTFYQTALRYRRSVFYTAGYDNSDPDTWPDESKGVATSLLPAPSITSVTWDRIANPDATTPLTVHQLTAFIELGTEKVGTEFATTPVVRQDGDDVIAVGAPGDTTLKGSFEDPAADPHDITCWIYHISDDKVVRSNKVTVNRWRGPTAPPGNVLIYATQNTGEYKVEWVWQLESKYDNPPYEGSVEIEERVNGGSWQNAPNTPIFDTTQNEYTRSGLNTGDSVEVRVAHAAAQAGAGDRSKFRPLLIPTITLN